MLPRHTLIHPLTPLITNRSLVIDRTHPDTFPTPPFFTNRSLRVVAVKPTVEGRAEEFGTVARIFRLLVREEFFDDPVRQKLVVETLLRETYPNDATTRVKVRLGQGP